MSTQIATELEQHVAASINAERAAAGLAALKIEAHLNASAQAHSDWMGDDRGPAATPARTAPTPPTGSRTRASR